MRDDKPVTQRLWTVHVNGTLSGRISIGQVGDNDTLGDALEALRIGESVSYTRCEPQYKYTRIK